MFWVRRTRFCHSEHVSLKLRTPKFWVLEKRVLRVGEHVSPTQNTFLWNFRSSEFGVSEKRVLSENRFLRLRTRFSDSEHVSPKFREFEVRSFGKTCTEWEHVSPTPNTFLRNLGSSKFVVSEKRVLSGNTFLRLRTRFSDSEHVSLKFREFGVRSFRKTCSEWEHVFSTQNTFLRLRTRFSDSEHVSPKFREFGVRSFGKTFRRNVFPTCFRSSLEFRRRTRFSDSRTRFSETSPTRTRFSEI